MKDTVRQCINDTTVDSTFRERVFFFFQLLNIRTIMTHSLDSDVKVRQLRSVENATKSDQ